MSKCWTLAKGNTEIKILFTSVKLMYFTQAIELEKLNFNVKKKLY